MLSVRHFHHSKLNKHELHFALYLHDFGTRSDPLIDEMIVIRFLKSTKDLV